MPRMVLRRLDVFTTAKWMLLPFTIMGFFAGGIYAVSLIRSTAGDSSLTVFYVVSLPLEYALVGFIATLVSALIYNAVAKRGRGIAFEIETDDDAPNPS